MLLYHLDTNLHLRERVLLTGSSMQFKWIYLWILMTHVFTIFGNDSAETLRNILIKTFGYDFSKLPEVGQVLYWKISTNEKELKLQVYIKNVTQFKSNETYVIFTQTQESFISIYYWLGMSTSLNNKKAAGKTAEFLYTLFQKYRSLVKVPKGRISISREVEAIESESLRNTLNFINRSGGRKRNRYHLYLDREYTSQFLNLYVVRGTSTTRVKKVSSGISWFLSDTCLIMDSGIKIDGLTPLSMYCGENVSDKTKRRSHMLMDDLYTLYIICEEPEPLLDFNKNDRNEARFKVFLEVLEDRKNFNPYDIDDSNDHLKDAVTFVSDRDKAVKYYWIKHRTIKFEGTDRTENTFEKVEDDGQFQFTPAFHYGCDVGIGFIFDSSSIAGLFVHINQKTSCGEKLAIIEMVEDHIEENYPFNSRPPQVRIKESPYGYYIFDFCINLSYYPTFYNIQDQVLEHW